MDCSSSLFLGRKSLPPPRAGEGWGALWVRVGVSPQRHCSLCAPGLRPTEPGNAKLDLTPSYLTPRTGQARALLHTFTFNCLDIRVIRQLKQIKATDLLEHNREEAHSFFTSQRSINVRGCVSRQVINSSFVGRKHAQEPVPSAHRAAYPAPAGDAHRHRNARNEIGIKQGFARRSAD